MAKSKIKKQQHVTKFSQNTFHSRTIRWLLRIKALVGSFLFVESHLVKFLFLALQNWCAIAFREWATFFLNFCDISFHQSFAKPCRRKMSERCCASRCCVTTVLILYRAIVPSSSPMLIDSLIEFFVDIFSQPCWLRHSSTKTRVKFDTLLLILLLKIYPLNISNIGIGQNLMAGM